MPGGHCGRGKLSRQKQAPHAESRRGCFRGALSERSGGTGRRAASLGVKMATLGLYYYPVYRYTYRGETYEQIGNVPAMEEQARKKVGTELTLFIDPAKPTSFYCLEEEKDYFQQRLAYLIVALLVIAVLIMIGVMWLTI